MTDSVGRAPPLKITVFPFTASLLKSFFPTAPTSTLNACPNYLPLFAALSKPSKNSLSTPPSVLKLTQAAKNVIAQPDIGSMTIVPFAASTSGMPAERELGAVSEIKMVRWQWFGRLKWEGMGRNSARLERAGL